MSIKEDAFSGCTSLMSVTIPASVTIIERNAFAECGNEFTIHAPTGSYAKKYAVRKNINFAPTPQV
jgi:hypothetical protein